MLSIFPDCDKLNDDDLGRLLTELHRSALATSPGSSATATAVPISSDSSDMGTSSGGSLLKRLKLVNCISMSLRLHIASPPEPLVAWLAATRPLSSPILTPENLIHSRPASSSSSYSASSAGMPLDTTLGRLLGQNETALGSTAIAQPHRAPRLSSGYGGVGLPQSPHVLRGRRSSSVAGRSEEGSFGYGSRATGVTGVGPNPLLFSRTGLGSRLAGSGGREENLACRTPRPSRQSQPALLTKSTPTGHGDHSFSLARPIREVLEFPGPDMFSPYTSYRYAPSLSSIQAFSHL
ncbi:unnamed protein product [Protopolystoma xenopodis]|uniref:Uncharacterized protein n=1 Tax=Protopolystoma xenopodis TaxID=117903 RepID=A0A448XI53_9PLAT|nr:unnamed protein product [Protopolystoma xenopodis]